MAFSEEGLGPRAMLDADVLFDFDRAELRRDAGPRLRRLVEEVSVRVPRRADSVRNWPVRQGRVPRPAVSTVGCGECRPVAPNSAPAGRDDPEGRRRNRRVEPLVTLR